MRTTTIASAIASALKAAYPALTHHATPVDSPRLPATITQVRGITYHDVLRRSQATYSLAVFVHVKRSPVDEAYDALARFVDPGPDGVMAILETSTIVDAASVRLKIDAARIHSEAITTEDALTAEFAVTCYDK